MTSTSTARRLAGASGVTSTAITRRLTCAGGAGGITSSCGNSGSGRRGVAVQTGNVHRISNSESSTTAGSNSSTVVPDKNNIGSTGDIDSPIEACACVTVTGK